MDVMLLGANLEIEAERISDANLLLFIVLQGGI